MGTGYSIHVFYLPTSPGKLNCSQQPYFSKFDPGMGDLTPISQLSVAAKFCISHLWLAVGYLGSLRALLRSLMVLA